MARAARAEREAGGGKGRPAKRVEANRLRAEEAQARAKAERTAVEATRLRARADAEAAEAAEAAAPAAEATSASESVAALHERLLEGKMLLDEEMATLRLEAAKAPVEKAAAGGRKSLAERMAEKHGIALSS